MRIIIYIPLFVDVTAPLLGAPSLAAYLSANGFQDVRVCDMNTELLHFLERSDYLEKQAEKVIADFESLNDGPAMTDGQASLYAQLHSLYSFCKFGLYGQWGNYLNKLRNGESFYDVLPYTITIKNYFEQCFKLMSYGQSWEVDFLFACRLNDALDVRGDLFDRFYREWLLPKFLELNPDVVGFSVCYSDQYQPAVSLAKRIREISPGKAIVFGGTHLNVLKEQHLMTEAGHFQFADFYILGEGEIPLAALLTEMEGARDWSRVPNLLYRDGDRVILNPLLDGVDIDKLPAPDYSVLPLADYLSPEMVLPYRIARGCYWNKCAFCVHFQTRHFSFKSADAVVADIKRYIGLFNTRCFYFVDDSLPKKFLDRFCQLLEEENIRILWVGNIRCEKFLNGDYIEKLARSGCKQLYLGIESGSQRILNLIRKGIDIAWCEKIINECHRCGIAVKMNFIKGLPYEDEQDIRETLDFIRRTAKNSDIIALTPLGIGENTDIAKNPDHFGVQLLDKKDPQRLFLSFKRTEGILEFDKIDRLYDENVDLFNRFSFFNRIHHMLFSTRFGAEEYQSLTPRLFMIEKKAREYLFRDSGAVTPDLSKKPVFAQKHMPLLLNFNLKQIAGYHQAEGAPPLAPRQTIYLYSLLNFEILSEISMFTYQFLILCDGVLTVQEIINRLHAQFPTVPLQEIEKHTITNLRNMYGLYVTDIA